MFSVDKSRLSINSLPQVLIRISEKISRIGGEVYVVGGWVRDRLLNINSKDFDLEVYGIGKEALEKTLKEFGNPNFVGKAFGVYIMNVKGQNFDFAFPRREIKMGKGHKGFEVESDPAMDFKEASSRRDFTINAMGYRLSDGALVDPHGGFEDLEYKILRHVSDAFSEDPLRALRAVQFAARFDLDIHPATQKLCAEQPLEELPPERVYEEFKKLLLKAKKPSAGMEWLRKMDLLRFFPELEALIGVEQEPEWHPEGDVWVHNNMVIDEAAIIRDAEISDDAPDAEFEKISLMLGALCHDLGKPRTTVFKDGRWRSPAHDVMGERDTRRFLKRLTRDVKLIEQVVVFVREHLKPALLYNAREEITQSAIRRLSLKVDIQKLVRVAKADHFGRTTPDALARKFPAGEWLLEQSRFLNVLDERPKPLLNGKMLLKLGLKPGPIMGNWIRECFELQLEGQISTEEEAFAWAEKKNNS